QERSVEGGRLLKVQRRNEPGLGKAGRRRFRHHGETTAGAAPACRVSISQWFSPLNLCRELLAHFLRGHWQSPPGQSDVDDFIVGNLSAAAVDPSGSRSVLLWIHVEGGELTSKDCQHLDRPSHQSLAPPEPTTLRDEQQDLALRCANDVADEANRNVLVVEHAKALQVTDTDRLREAPVHSFLGRHRVLLWV